MDKILLRQTVGSLQFDAYYKDEFGKINDATNTSGTSTTLDGVTEKDKPKRVGVHKNIFTQVGAGTNVVESGETLRKPFYNKAHPEKNISTTYELSIYFSESVTNYAKKIGAGEWIKPIQFTLFFAVGHELNRHGIRSFFKDQTDLQAIIQLPGIESMPRSGVAIDDAQISKILDAHFQKKVPYHIKVLAAFSTGSYGLNQALDHKLIKVTEVERLVFYDCLYKELSKIETAKAIKYLKSQTNNLKIVIYKVTECGNTWKRKPSTDPNRFKCPNDTMAPNEEYDYNNLAVVSANPGLIASEGIITNLFQNRRYQALIVFRALEAAVQDKIITLNSNNKNEYRDMELMMRGYKRGMFISSEKCYVYVRKKLPAVYNNFENWPSAQNEKNILWAFMGKLGSVSKQDSFLRLLWKNAIPGWLGTDGEEKHDLLIPEFGWEYLPF